MCAMMATQVYSPSRPPPLSKNLPGELWQVGKTVTQGELEVVNPGYVFNTISSIPPGEGRKPVRTLPVHSARARQGFSELSANPSIRR